MAITIMKKMVKFMMKRTGKMSTSGKMPKIHQSPVVLLTSEYYSKRIKKVVIARALARSNLCRGIASLSLAMTIAYHLIKIFTTP